MRVWCMCKKSPEANNVPHESPALAGRILTKTRQMLNLMIIVIIIILQIQVNFLQKV